MLTSGFARVVCVFRRNQLLFVKLKAIKHNVSLQLHRPVPGAATREPSATGERPAIEEMLMTLPGSAFVEPLARRSVNLRATLVAGRSTR